jgi:hypothetical protein
VRREATATVKSLLVAIGSYAYLWALGASLGLSIDLEVPVLFALVVGGAFAAKRYAKSRVFTIGAAIGAIAWSVSALVGAYMT